MIKIAVIGGGISGVSCAYYLNSFFQKQNLPFSLSLFESSKRLGGAVFSEKFEGCNIENGVDSFQVEERDILQLCRETGLINEILNSDEARRETLIYWDGTLRSMPGDVMMSIPSRFLPFVTDSFLSWPGKIRMGMDLFIPGKKTFEDESFAHFIQRRLGNEALKKMAEPLISGITGSDVEEMSIQSTFPFYTDLEREYGSLILGLYKKRRKFLQAMPKGYKPRYSFFLSLENGIGQLIEKMTEVLPTDNIIFSKVNSIRKKNNLSPEEKAYELIFENGPPEKFNIAVLATPANITASLLSNLDSSLAEELRAIPYKSAITVNQIYAKRDVPKDLKGFGFILPKRERRFIKAGSWFSLKFPRRAPDDTVVIRSSISGEMMSSLMNMDDEAISRVVNNELRDIAAITSNPTTYRVCRWENTRPQYTLGHSKRMELITRLAHRHENLYLTGSAYHGAGIGSCVRSAKKMAEEICNGKEFKTVVNDK